MRRQPSQVWCSWPCRSTSSGSSSTPGAAGAGAADAAAVADGRRRLDVGLIPGQGTTALGLELLIIGGGFTATIAWLFKKSVAGLREHVSVGWHLALIVPGTVPFVLGGASILGQTGGGLYWIICALIGACINAWVLVVEILR